MKPACQDVLPAAARHFERNLGTTYYRAKTMCSKLLKLFQSCIFPSFQSLSRFSSVIFFLYV